MKKYLFDCGVAIDTRDWFQVFSASLGKVQAQQASCVDAVVKDRDWNVDLSAGFLYFGADAYPVQFIGSESASSNTWLWGWENINGFPESVVATAHEMKRMGERYGLTPFTTAKLALTDTINGHNLAMAVCALSRGSICYYRGPHAGGAVLMTFSGAPDTVFVPVSMHTFIDVSMRCIQQYEVDHRIFLASFLYQNDTPFTWDGDTIIAHFDTDLRIALEENQGRWRMTGMRSA